MKYLPIIVKTLIPKKLSTPMGRWTIDYCSIKINNKIDLSNEDHCGSCGKYALTKMELNDKNNTEVHIKNNKIIKL
jgi:hypothetical protein